MASSLPDALDYLVAQIRALPQAQPPVVVSDGWPAQRGDNGIVIGVNPEGDETGIAGSYTELSGEEYEDVEVPCILWARRAGTDAASAARRAAFALFDAVRDLVKADRRFGGAIRPGMPAQVATWTVAQTSSVTQAGEGRVCEIRFVVAWRHRG